MGVNNFHGDLTILLSLSWSRLVQSSYMEGFFQQQENVLHINKPLLPEKACTTAGEETARKTTQLFPPPTAWGSQAELYRLDKTQRSQWKWRDVCRAEHHGDRELCHGNPQCPRVQSSTAPMMELPPFSCWATHHQSAGAAWCSP